jgi:hypothetical protein
VPQQKQHVADRLTEQNKAEACDHRPWRPRGGMSARGRSRSSHVLDFLPSEASAWIAYLAWKLIDEKS